MARSFVPSQMPTRHESPTTRSCPSGVGCRPDVFTSLRSIGVSLSLFTCSSNGRSRSVRSKSGAHPYPGGARHEQNGRSHAKAVERRHRFGRDHRGVGVRVLAQRRTGRRCGDVQSRNGAVGNTVRSALRGRDGDGRRTVCRGGGRCHWRGREWRRWGCGSGWGRCGGGRGMGGWRCRRRERCMGWRRRGG